ncbi:MAG TPA: TlpA disulfide reductase family protein [Thermoanaerobaculia bacterium]
MNRISIRLPLALRAAVTLTLLATLLWACDPMPAGAGREVAAPRGGKMIGSQADFRLKSMDGRVLGPKDFPGKVVVVDFWATWCQPCRLQAEILEPLSRQLAGANVQFLAANSGEAEPTVRAFVRKTPFSYPVLLDADDSLSNQLGIEGLPTLMVVDKAGKVTYFEAGVADGDTLKRIIQKAGV